jgi:hypothetical protein
MKWFNYNQLLLLQPTALLPARYYNRPNHWLANANICFRAFHLTQFFPPQKKFSRSLTTTSSFDRSKCESTCRRALKPTVASLGEEKDYWQSASESEKQRNYKIYSITSWDRQQQIKCSNSNKKTGRGFRFGIKNYLKLLAFEINYPSPGVYGGNSSAVHVSGF